MSYISERNVLRCDDIGCIQGWGDAIYADRDTAAAALRKSARRRAGWSVSTTGDRDFCPLHVGTAEGGQ